MRQLSDLQRAGIELAIDDGTGYASLSLVAGVIALAKSFEMSCTAEGIENETQRTSLAERGVLGKGLLLGIPDDAVVIGRRVLPRGGPHRSHPPRSPGPDAQNRSC